MPSIIPPWNATAPVREALEVIGSDLDAELSGLATSEQHQFWGQLHQFAVGQTRHRGREVSLIAHPNLAEGVRRALQQTDARMARHLAELSAAERDILWAGIHEHAEVQMQQTKSPAAGSESRV